MHTCNGKKMTITTVNHFKDPLNETQIQSRATRTSKKIEVGAGIMDE